MQERRRHIRIAAAYPAVLRDARGRQIARGRTANISESGVLILASLRKPPAIDRQVIVELTVPGASSLADRPQRPRVVCYRSRIARIQPIGNLTGLGIEFLQKL